MTNRLYYDDAYTLRFSASIVERTEHKSRPAVILDRSYFYPEGGAQPPDTGSLNGIRVIDVQTRDSDRAVLHILASSLNGADQVEGEIDASRRLDHMQHHSGQHILSRALDDVAKAATVSVHMSADSMTIDVNRADIPAAEWSAVEQLANRIVQEDRPVRCWFPTAEELATIQVRKMPDVIGKVRIVDIGGFDITACGGTHVARTGEIGLIKVIKTEKRGDSTRLEFRCGLRALADYSAKNEVIQRLVSDLTVGASELPAAIGRLQAENKQLRTDLKVAKDLLAEAEAQSLLATAEPHNGHRLIIRAFSADRTTDDARLLLQKLTAQADVIVLFGVSGEGHNFSLGVPRMSLDVVPHLNQHSRISAVIAAVVSPISHRAAASPPRSIKCWQQRCRQLSQ
ncbi:MAG: alanyl-tRNA editing protein [Anaerolineae bacterium]